MQVQRPPPGAAPSTARPATARAEIAVFDASTIWRFHVTFRPRLIGTSSAAEERRVPRDPWVKYHEGIPSPLPPSGWQGSDFDDSGWPRRPLPLFGGYGGCRSAGVALICLRARFGVENPRKVRGLTLRLTYRGGAVVHLNGREIARAHMPEGHVEALTPARDYPREAFVAPGGKKLLPSLRSPKPPAKLADRYGKRIRTCTVSVPAAALRKGCNVLAVELHRTAVPADLPKSRRGTWETAGALNAALTAGAGSAVAPNTAAAGGPQIWAAEALLRVGVDADRGDPFAGPPRVRMVAPRNGFASGQLVVGPAGPLTGLSAKASNLRSAAGGVIPSAAVRVRYAKLGATYVPLLDRPVDGAKLQPIWLTVRVPPQAEAGTYKGTLRIFGPKRPATAAIELKVCRWQVADPRRWRTVVNLLQSPQSVAGRYNVRLWSDRHFALLEKSLVLMGACGNDVLGISAVGKSVFGDDPVVLFRRAGGGIVPELKHAERYLRLYDKHAGEPLFLAVQVWNYGMYYRGTGRDGGSTRKRIRVIPVVELRGDTLMGVEVPIYGEPGTERTWRAVMGGLAELIRKLGWHKTRIVLGTSGDTWPSEQTVRFFKKIAPQVQWRSLTHGGGCPRWGISAHERTQPNQMVVGYLEIARRIRNWRVHRAEYPVTCNARDLVGASPFHLRGLATVNAVLARFDGVCWKGLDYWTYTTAGGGKLNALNTYVRFGNMVGGTPRALAAAGPDGAVSTVQLEMLRQGIQDCEAALAVREALAVLCPRRRRTYDLGVVTLKDALWRASRRKGEPPSKTYPRDLDLHLLFDDGRLVRIVPRAPTYNKGDHTAEFKELACDDGRKLDVRVTLGDDRWVQGGRGRYVVCLRRDGDVYGGEYTGAFRQVARKGAVTGAFTRGGHVEQAQGPKRRSPLAERCERVVHGVADMFLAGTRVPAHGGADVRRLVTELYELASEVTAAAEAKKAPAGD